MEEKQIKYIGWLISILLIIAGAYFIWHRIHINLLGDVLIYLGVRIFNFATWDEYKEKRKNLLKFTKHQSKIVADECSAKLNYLDAYYNVEFQEYNQTIKLTNRIIYSYSMEFDWLLGLSYLLRAKTYIEINEISKAKEDLKVVSKMDF